MVPIVCQYVINSSSSNYLTLSTYSSIIAMYGLILLIVQSLLCSYSTVTYSNSLLLSEHYSLIVYKAFGCLKASPWAPFLVIKWIHIAHVACSVVTSNSHTTLWSYLHVITQAVLAILSLLFDLTLIIIKFDLCNFDLPPISKLICLPKIIIHSSMC